MFSLCDLAFERSAACPGGGYTAVKGRYSKRHMLLMQWFVVLDMGDPIFSSTSPFELMHKLKTKSAYLLSLKHDKTIAAHILKKVRYSDPCSSHQWCLWHPFVKSSCPQDLLDRLFEVLIPLAAGLPTSQPLAPLDAAPPKIQLVSKLSEDHALSPLHSLEGSARDDFKRAWCLAVGAGTVPAGPFDERCVRAFASAELSGGKCGNNPLTLSPGCACELQSPDVPGAWQPQPGADSDNDSDGERVDLVAAPVKRRRRGQKTGGRGRARGARSRGRGRRIVAPAPTTVSSSSSSSSSSETSAVPRGGQGRRGRGAAGQRRSARISAAVPSAAGFREVGSSSDESSKQQRRGRKRLRGRSASLSKRRHSSSDTDTRAESQSGADSAASSASSTDTAASSSDGERGVSGAVATAAPAVVAVTMEDHRAALKLASRDLRRRRLLSCDPVVRVRLFFEYRAGAATAASAAAPSAVGAPLQFAFAYRYSAVPELDAFAELGSRDFTVRECTAAGAVIVPLTSIVRPRRRVPVPTDQLPLGWGAPALSLAAGAPARRSPEYIWVW